MASMYRTRGFMFSIAALAAVAAWGVAHSQAPATPPSVALDAQLTPTDVTTIKPGQLLIAVSGTAPLGKLSLIVKAPTGVTVTPARLEVDSTSTTARVSATVQGKAAAEGHLIVTAERLAGASQIQIADDTVALKISPEVTVAGYLAWGLAGGILGYGLRIIVKALQSITPPNPAPLASDPPEGKITAFVRRHFYWVDCAVTIVIVAVLLLSLVLDGRAPASYRAWYSIFPYGVGLGLLANSDLILRFKK